MAAPLPDPAPFSPPIALWCPYCRQPFIGTVERSTGRFAHGTCPVARVDLGRLEDLAGSDWFWSRFRDRVMGRSQ